MHARPPITGQLARYALALLLSVSLHWLIFRSSWSFRSADTPAQIELQQGLHAVELTLAPSVASQAAKPQKKIEKPETTPPEPVPKPAEPEIAAPAEPPDPVELEGEAPAEPEPAPPEPAKENQPSEISDQPSIDSLEQTGSLQTKGVSAAVSGSFKNEYPTRSRQRGEEGTVTIEAHISADGKMTAARVVNSSGFRLLDASALKSVQKAHFTPAIKKGKPVADVITLSFKFELT
jgi:protein TonB